MEIPALAKIEQNFPRPRLEDLSRTLREELARSGVRIGRGAQIAVPPPGESSSWDA
ncbi:MAG: hypothetical protein ACUVRM_04085 [Bacillota bacterium]